MYIYYNDHLFRHNSKSFSYQINMKLPVSNKIVVSLESSYIYCLSHMCVFG